METNKLKYCQSSQIYLSNIKAENPEKRKNGIAKSWLEDIETILDLWDVRTYFN